jgi:FKBP-type peptidyl-prolyl cis-trans isomerase FkpA
MHLRVRHDARAVRGDRHDVSDPDRQHHQNPRNGAEGAALWRRLLKKILVYVALALSIAGCDNNSSPTDPSQVNIEFTITDIVVGTGAEARQGNTASTNYTLWLYDASGSESKGRFVQNGNLPPFVIGAGTLIRGYEQGVLGMRVGGKRRMYIPASMGFGSSGTQDGSVP